ncbi:hypothetical protein QQS21_011611 [Conoideocrella luteorostrata]|uniref:Uncharacterized protein n=1 Tax=Conoideocrella luteorostrata TaxID=1105319 RepID=A0AAJ0FVQ4_9HYPO|nr:hypothetical protein QQS21_011611 [Conoideocrella luteorostrata]
MAPELPCKRKGEELTPEAGSSHQKACRAEDNQAAVPACTPQQPRDDVVDQHQHQPISSPPKSNLTPPRCMDGQIRSPSTSPPAEPPAQEFMIPSDDRFRMMQDDLLRMARRFTAHLRRAEYNRLKMQTQRQYAEIIRELERPVVQPHGGGATLTAQRMNIGSGDVSTRAAAGFASRADKKQEQEQEQEQQEQEEQKEE